MFARTPSLATSFVDEVGDNLLLTKHIQDRLVEKKTEMKI